MLSPNAAKSASMVTNVPCRPLCEGYFHQTILNNCYKITNRHSGSSRRYTSGAKSAWSADFLPDVIRQENKEVPQRGLEGRLAISRRYTSGAKPAWNGAFRPNVTRPENRKVPQKGLEGKSEGLKLLFGRPEGQNITICAIFVKYEPNSTRCRQVRRRGGRRLHPGCARR